MKIGLIRRGYSGSGGAERYLLRFVEALRASGHETILFGSPEWPADAWQGERIRIEGRGPREFADRLATARPREHCDLLFSFERVWECDAYRAGDGVHRAWLERRRAFEPWWKGAFRALQGKHREILELEQAVFDPAAKRLIVANSHMVAGEIAHYFRVPRERLRVIHNGLPPEEFSGATASAGQPSRTVLFAGSGWERKGLRYAIAAINKTRDATLHVAGTGKRSGLPASARTRFLGAVSDMPALMATAGLFLLPTLYDPFSNASLEAMAAGLPVITTTANGFTEIMRTGEDGEVLDNPSDTDAIAAAIEKWIARETAETREARRAEARKYTVESNVRQTLEAVLQIQN